MNKEKTKNSISERTFDAATANALRREGVTPLLARILAARGVSSYEKLTGKLKHLLHHSLLKGTQEAASFLVDAVTNHKQMVIIADYDCDGATACAVGLRGLKNIGADVHYVVPDRMVHGYGLTPSVVDLATSRYPQAQVLITVDNGIASHAGVQAAVDKGLEVLVTDHHLPVKDKPLPNARVIVNPSQPGCNFPSKALAGVGVIWYVLWALQDMLRGRGVEVPDNTKVSTLLPLVAIGTVADVVPLDENNRILVQAGLARIRTGQSFPGVDALARVGYSSRTRLEELVTTDIAFGIGPRINAAGRLKTMDVGIECLTTDDQTRAQKLATELDSINQERKSIEQDTVEEAVAQANALIAPDAGTLSISVHSRNWHPGVIGIVAGRIKEQRWRPTFVLTSDPDTGELKGSGRSIPGFNLKDALDQLDKSDPGLLLKFGGHAMAAGVTVVAGGFRRFRDGFEEQVRLHLDKTLLLQKIEHDGSLMGLELRVHTARELAAPPWGQLFLEPSFCDTFNVKEAKLIGASKNHLHMTVEREGVTLDAMKFRFEGELPAGEVRLVYKLSRNRNKWGNEYLSLLVDHILNN